MLAVLAVLAVLALLAVLRCCGGVLGGGRAAVLDAGRRAEGRHMGHVPARPRVTQRSRHICN